MVAEAQLCITASVRTKSELIVSYVLSPSQMNIL